MLTVRSIAFLSAFSAILMLVGSFIVVRELAVRLSLLVLLLTYELILTS